MKNSTIFLICMAFLLTVVALTFNAASSCSSCTKEGDWSQSANAFINGQPISDEPIAFGPKAARQTSSQFDKASTAADSTAGAANAGIILKSINATPAQANPTDKVRITAIFAKNGSDEQLQLSTAATIKDSTGKEVRKLNLIKTAVNEYSNDWLASVPAGIYNIDITASSLDGSASFENALQIEVKSSDEGNATSTDSPSNATA